jgi:hypothetical protein
MKKSGRVSIFMMRTYIYKFSEITHVDIRIEQGTVIGVGVKGDSERR